MGAHVGSHGGHFTAVLKVGLEALADDLDIEVKRKREIADDS